MAELTIEEHAIERFAERLEERTLSKTKEEVEAEAKAKITSTVYTPDWIYHEKEDMCQIHVSEEYDVAVPVGVKGEGEWEVLPYDNLSQDLVVKSTYDAETFRRKRNNNKDRAEA